VVNFYPSTHLYGCVRGWITSLSNHVTKNADDPTSFMLMGSEAGCATKRSDGMDGKSPCLYEAGIEPLGRSVRWMQTGGERAAPERYWCGAMQAAKMPGLAQGPQGEYTK
jgi:hypothetical protein